VHQLIIHQNQLFKNQRVKRQRQHFQRQPDPQRNPPGGTDINPGGQPESTDIPLDSTDQDGLEEDPSGRATNDSAVENEASSTELTE